MADPRPQCDETTREGAPCTRRLDKDGTCDQEYRHQQADTHEPPGYRTEALEWN